MWEGAIQHSAVKRFELGGQDLTALLARQLSESNPNVSLDLSTVQMLKEKYAEVPEDQSDYDSSAEACPSVEHTLPDGQVHKVSMFQVQKMSTPVADCGIVCGSYGVQRIKLLCSGINKLLFTNYR